MTLRIVEKNDLIIYIAEGTTASGRRISLSLSQDIEVVSQKATTPQLRFSWET